MNKLPKRKNLRIQGFDYKHGMYFVTICTHDKKKLFGNINFKKEAVMILNENGKLVENRLSQFEEFVQYVIMPNHIHILVLIDTNKTLQQIIRTFKSLVTKDLGFQTWQRSYYERIVRNEKEFEIFSHYIEYNAETWRGDKYFIS